MPTFKSTGETQIYIVERDSDGTQRIARAIQDGNHWRCQVEHPSRVMECSNVFGNRGDVKLALTHYLHQTETEWKNEKARGHRPESRPRDVNVPVDDFGEYRNAQITPRR
jgi:hypothetical protein